MKITFEKFDNLMKNKYKAKEISKKSFKDSIYGPARDDIDDNIETLSEGLICSENAIFYLINDIEVINKNCKCIDPSMFFSNGEVLPLPLSEYMPYIVLVAELSKDNKYMTNYAKWGSFSDNIIEELNQIDDDKEL